eukprot:754794-Hanusia_phi.AAC.7
MGEEEQEGERRTVRWRREERERRRRREGGGVSADQGSIWEGKVEDPERRGRRSSCQLYTSGSLSSTAVDTFSCRNMYSVCSSVPQRNRTMSDPLGTCSEEATAARIYASRSQVRGGGGEWGRPAQSEEKMGDEVALLLEQICSTSISSSSWEGGDHLFQVGPWGGTGKSASKSQREDRVAC